MFAFVCLDLMLVLVIWSLLFCGDGIGGIVGMMEGMVICVFFVVDGGGGY